MVEYLIIAPQAWEFSLSGFAYTGSMAIQDMIAPEVGKINIISTCCELILLFYRYNNSGCQ
jgi:hypothetical protein